MTTRTVKTTQTTIRTTIGMVWVVAEAVVIAAAMLTMTTTTQTFIIFLVS